jgi:hypothetical protein
MKSIKDLSNSNKTSISLVPVNNEGLRSSVEWFATMMELKLQSNDDKPGWKDTNVNDLLDRVVDELDELTNALLLDHSPQAIIQECADVANFCMMIADNIRRQI